MESKYIRFVPEHKIKFSAFNLFFKILIILFLSIIVVILLTTALLFTNKLLILIDNTNNLVKNEIPLQMKYYHDLADNTKSKIDLIEQKIIQDLRSLSELLMYSNQFLINYNKYFNNNLFDKIVLIINNVEMFTDKSKLKELEHNLSIIAQCLENILSNNTQVK